MNRASARTQILSRLHRNAAQSKGYTETAEAWIPATLPPKKRIETFVTHMEAVRSEVYRVKEDVWVEAVQKLLSERNLETLAYGKGTWCAEELESAWKKKHPTTLVPWEKPIESFKDELFGIHAGITTTMGGIAEAGALILWPTPQEPRLLSLVPPVHIALVKASDIFTSFPEAIKKLNWGKKAPTNALLISGPSKTADIELILQYGVHGPTDLIVLLIE